TPKNWGGTSGRINSVAVSPADTRVILVGGATGGIWRSADGGVNFAPVSDNQIDLPVSWISFAPSNPSTVYAAMGDIDSAYLGAGVLKSLDAGQTWARVSNSTLPDGIAARLAVDPSNPQRVYLAQNVTKDRSTNATLASGFFISTDGGVNWARTFAGQMRDLVLHPTNPQTIYATVGTRGFATADLGSAPGLYRSNDSGQTWSAVTTPATGFRAPVYDFRIAVAPSDPQRVYIYVGSIFSDERRLYSSRDGASTWQPSNFSGVDTGQFGYNTYLEVDPTNADTVYVGSRDVWKSTNGGASWTNLTINFVPSGGGGWSYQPGSSSLHPDQQAFAFEPGNPSVVYLAGDGGLWKSSDGGSTVQSLNRTLSLVQFTSLAVHPTDGGFTIGGTQDNGTQRRLRDASGLPSVGWDAFAGSDGGACFFNPSNPTILYGTYFSAWVNRFRVSGSNILFDKQIGTYSTWGESTTNTRIAFYPPFTGNGVNQRIYFGSWRLFVSDNLGDSWYAPAGFTDLTKGGSDTLSTIAVSPSDTNTIYTGSGQGRVMVSRDGGSTWADITAGLPQRFIEKIVVDPSDPATAYLAVSGFGTGHVFKTASAGAAWADVSGNLPNIPTNALLIDPLDRNVLYAGTDVGVFRSAAAGGAWEYFNDGLPPAPVVAFAAQASGRIQLATYGRGAYELTTVEVGPSSVAFAAASVSASEGAGSVRLTVTRTGDLSLPARVDYATSDGTAGDRADYTAAFGTLRFGAEETTKTLDVFVTDDRFAEGPESFSVTLSNAAGATLGAVPTATVNVADNDAATGTNPVRWDAGFDTQFFVRQHYVDFFNREPDAAGLAHWTNVIDSCGADNLCREARRVNVSAAFFLSIEFQETGFVVYLAHQAAFQTAERLRLKDFLADVRGIGRGIVVNQGDWKGQIEANKTAFFDEFVTRAAFASKFGALSNAQYVDALNAGAGGALTQAERDALVAGLGAGTLTRARALRSVVENHAFGRGHYNRAFVLMQYFGYLRRNPDDAPEQNRDFTGYNHWLTNLEKFNGNFEQAEMVKAFILSEEYQRRFGP
ncbi:MAG TPA: Calx-beta domain-containing protein, partial [Pyrinomonadaceae bacterium]|nr:Calx-beta domain-containing protein [Pyrinomonadaceae bacterium]